MHLIRWLTRLRSRALSERGQILLVFVMLIVPLTFVMGVVSVDVGIWMSERRGAQKDADLAALAGAYELLNVVQDANAARTAAVDYAAKNDEAANARIIDQAGNPCAVETTCVAVDNSCFHTSYLDSVIVDVAHDSRTFFAESFGILTPAIGAHARACMGSPIEGTGLIPLGVQVSGFDSECFQPDPNDPGGTEIPIFGEYCRLAFGAGDTTSGEGGLLRLFDDGGATCSAPSTGGGAATQNEISQGGANTTCYVAPPGTTSADCTEPPPTGWPYPYVNFCVWPKTQVGGNTPIQQAFQDLIATEGACDAAFGTDANTIDDWLEVVQAANGDPTPDPGTTTFSRRACTSPRLVTLIILEAFSAQGNGPAPILAFASFYIDGCILPDNSVYRTCDIQGGGSGQTNLYGFFMNILDVDSVIGAPTKYGQRQIALTE